MELELLDWDSAFFNFKTGLIEGKTFSNSNLTDLILKAKIENYKLLYLWLTESNNEETQIAVNLGATLVDTKITFQLMLNPDNKYVLDPAIVSFNSTNHSYAKLKALGLESGVYSRFKIDTRIPTKKFEEMYGLWIDNSLNGKFADDVLVYITNNVVGFVSLAYKNGVAKIGLIGVDANTRGLGIGSKLLSAVAHKARLNNCKSVLVPTQKANELACNFYLRNGYKPHKEEDILHLWL